MGHARQVNEETFTNPKKWKKTFDTIMKLLEDQKSHIEALDEDRKRLEDRIRIQFEQWVSDVRSLEYELELTKMQVKSAEMMRIVEVARTVLASSLCKKQNTVLKLKLGLSEDELNDFIEWFDILSHRCPDGQVISKEALNQIKNGEVGQTNSSSKCSRKKRGGGGDTKALEDEIARLKCEYEKLSIKRSSDLSALSSEKEFAWIQYKEMENSYNRKLQVKDEEVRQAKELLENISRLDKLNEEKDVQISEMESSYNRKLQMKDEEIKKANDRIEELQENIRRLESLNQEKDVQISEMKASYSSKIVAAKVGKDQEIVGLLAAREKARRSSGTTTPTLRRCSRLESKRSQPKHADRRQTRSSISSQDKELSSTCEANRRQTRSSISSRDKQLSSSSEGSKRKRYDAVEIPKLFTSHFKVPKLKRPSSSSV